MSNKNITSLLTVINSRLGKPDEPYSKFDDVSYKANVGNIHYEQNASGYSICEMSNDSGGVNTFASGLSKKELELYLQAIAVGLHLSGK